MDLIFWPMTAEIHLLGFMERILELIDQIPLIVFFLPFQVWMFWDSLRREKWLWMWAIIFLWIPAVPYYFLVYRPISKKTPQISKKMKLFATSGVTTENWFRSGLKILKIEKSKSNS